MQTDNNGVCSNLIAYRLLRISVSDSAVIPYTVFCILTLKIVKQLSFRSGTCSRLSVVKIVKRYLTWFWFCCWCICRQIINFIVGLRLILYYAGDDPGFWFGIGTGPCCWTEVPQRGPGQSSGRGLGAKPPEARRMLLHEAKKTTETSP